MKKSGFIVLAIFLASTGARGSFVSASEEAAPKIILMQRGATTFLQDLEAVMQLTVANDRGEWPALKKNLETFLIGVDRERPMRLDFLTGDGPMRNRFTVPVDDLQEFRVNNLSANGITISRKLSASLYRLTGQTYQGFVRMRQGYASFGDRTSDLPYELPDPEAAIEDLLTKQYDFALKGVNQADGQEARKKYFEAADGLRAELMGTIVKRKEESAEAWEARRMAYDHQLDEIGQLYVQTQRLVLGTNIESKKSLADAEAELVALPGTNLEQTIARVGTLPSRFGDIALLSDSVLSLRGMLPLSQMRQDNLREQITHQRDWAHKRAAARTSTTAEQQAASRETADLAYDMINKTIETGWADLTIDVSPTSGGFHQAVAGLVIADGSQLQAMLDALANSGTDREIKLNAEKVGEMSLHRITVRREQYPFYHHLIGQDTAYIGTLDNVLWIAGGAGALDRLKDVVGKTRSPANPGTPDPRALRLQGRFGPWMRVMHLSQTEQNAVEDPQVIKWRQLAIAAATAGDDQLEITIQKDGTRLTGTGLAKTGLLRFLGKVAADFSREQINAE